MTVLECEKFIQQKHGSQIRKQGTPYFLHPMAVAKILKEKGFGEEYQIVGLCHDLLEDTDVTYEELINITNLKIAKAVKLLTKENGYKMCEYIENIKQNKFALPVKLADRIHNLSESLLANEEFRIKYIAETRDYYMELAKETEFEKDLKKIVEKVEKSLDII